MKYIDLMVSMIENGYNISEISLKKWLQPKSTLRPSISGISAMAQALGLNFSDIVEMDEAASNIFGVATMGVKFIPIIGVASCGRPEMSFNDDINESIPYPKNLWNKNLYAVRACGESMSPEIDNGDVVVCDKMATIKNGDLVHYTLFNDAAIKIYYKDDMKNIKLIPRNQSPAFMTVNIMHNDDGLLENFTATKVVCITKSDTDSRLARLKAVGLA
ncbi:hypothetical protein KDD93_00010 [Campylobacter sp. faydin G-24]|uniref:Peptidase S24/S26A/S26B/S26C domain-containing protein n=2 Tax=Campylobacter anatolicus TaxID=2829105 RepID=A0ABS5HFB3_9BACT|nr:hypothetical protein [Campylobacter anatolicus]